MTDLMAPHGPLAYFLDLHPSLGDFRADALAGLALEQKAISPMYFYDEHGSKIFDRITTAEDYYPTRTEKSISLGNAAEITAAIGAKTSIFEYGSGSSEKIQWLINGLEDPVAYVAMDISKEHLIENASNQARLQKIPIAAVCANFHTPIELPQNILPNADRWLGYFPGSTLGNMEPETAIAFLNRASDTLGPDAKFLLGIDQDKDPKILNAAYNDSDGLSAALNLNLLTRMKRELDATVTMDDFEHYAFYNEALCRIEMHLRAVRPTEIVVNDQKFDFKKDETLNTEFSYKYSIDRLQSLVESTPWRLEKAWTDENDWFATCLLSNN